MIVNDNTELGFSLTSAFFMFLLSQVTACECPLPIRISKCRDNSVLFGNSIIQIMELKLADIIKQVFAGRKARKISPDPE